MKKIIYLLGFLLFFCVVLVVVLRGVLMSHYYERGIEYMNNNQYEEGIENFNRSIWLNFGSKRAHKTYWNRGVAYKKLGKSEQAIEDFSQAIYLYSKYVEEAQSAINLSLYFNERGLTYHSFNKYELAINDYDKSIELNPKFGQAYINRSVTNFSLNKYQFAVCDLVKSIEFGANPSYGLRKSLGEVCRKLGDKSFESKRFHESIEFYNKLSRINPSLFSEDIKVRLGKSYYELGNKDIKSKLYEKALKKYKKGYEFYPRDTYKLRIYKTIVKLSQERESNGKYQEAIKFYKEALEYSSKYNSYIKNKIHYLNSLQKCKEAKIELDDGDYYYYRIDWNLMEETNNILKNIKINRDISIYDKDRLLRNLRNALEMTDYWRKAHQHYKEAMRLSRDWNCKEIEKKAFYANAKMMNRFIFSANEITRFILQLQKRYKRGY